MRTSLGKSRTAVERREALEAALMRMMAHPEKERPFVVLEHAQSGVFVQFCGSQTRPLTFDVPSLGKTVDLGPGSDPTVYHRAVCLGFETLGAILRARGDDRKALPHQTRELLSIDDELFLEESVGEAAGEPS